MMDKKDDLMSILKEERVFPVFQPIVSLKSGEVYGYEALSRIKNPKKIKNADELFNVGLKCGKTWELEKLCRKKILRTYSSFTEEQRTGYLFLNVNPMVIEDPKFKSNFTRKQLNKCGIDADKIVIEVTERGTIKDIEQFADIIHHYKDEGYQIAIDDVGECYSGLNVICKTIPHFLKIDMSLVRDVDHDFMKYALVKGLVEIAKNTSIQLIAEGIETTEELQCMIDLGVDFGQGYLLGKPDMDLRSVDIEIA